MRFDGRVVRFKRKKGKEREKRYLGRWESRTGRNKWRGKETIRFIGGGI